MRHASSAAQVTRCFAISQYRPVTANINDPRPGAETHREGVRVQSGAAKNTVRRYVAADGWMAYSRQAAPVDPGGFLTPPRRGPESLTICIECQLLTLWDRGERQTLTAR